MTYFRYYEKSIIEQAINQERSKLANNWEETKKSIRDARYRLSLSNSEHAEHKIKEVRGKDASKKLQLLTIDYF